MKLTAQIIDELRLGDIVSCAVSEAPDSPCFDYTVNGEKYEPVVVYDAPKGIAFKYGGDDSFIGKEVVFNIDE